MKVLGIDIGGSAVKGAPVDTKTGRLLAERHRIETPAGQTPAETARAVRALVDHFKWRGPVGIGFPGAIVDGRVVFVGNLSQQWVGRDAVQLFAKATACRVAVLNDADAAGLAEMRFGAGRGETGSVLMLTAGTGIGNALFREGVLVPNLELGQLRYRGRPVERYAAASVRQRLGLNWRQWAERFNVYLRLVDGIVWPELVIIGGGLSKEHAQWLKFIKARPRVVPAQLHNDAGIIGAGLVAALRRR